MTDPFLASAITETTAAVAARVTTHSMRHKATSMHLRLPQSRQPNLFSMSRSMKLMSYDFAFAVANCLEHFMRFYRNRNENQQLWFMPKSVYLRHGRTSLDGA